MNDTDRDRFYAERDRRTHQYGANDDALTTPIALVCSDDITDTRAGQAAILALVETVARVHRKITVIAADRPLAIDALMTSTSLHAAVAERATAIDPYITIQTTAPADATTAADGTITLGLGTAARPGLDLYAGWTGGLGIIDTNPVPARGSSDGDLVGAATAACLAAAAAFRLAHGQPVQPSRVNLATRTSGDNAPTTSTVGPIDVGDVLIIGAGAVTHALTYWARLLGITGRWTLVDRDLAELHNTNRCLGMTAADAGWASGRPGGPVRYKADTAAEIIGAHAAPCWYDEWIATSPPRPDLQLCLANERGIRPTVAALGEPVLLHATTSSNWTAELHRHIAGRDDCPACRLPEVSRPQFKCSTGPADPTRSDSGDAALPFLSAAAGLMLAIALCQLPDGGELITGSQNHWRLSFEEGPVLRSSRWQHGRCPHMLTRPVRATLQRAAPSLWDHLDAAQPTL